MSKPRPFNINIFVAEGIPDGLRIVTKSNWIGQALVCPRSRYPEVKSRTEFQHSGIYLLVGRSEADDQPLLYIGEAETVRTRLDSHYANKDFWTQAVIFTTTSNSLNKAEVQFLEARLVELATEYKRCALDNGNTPQRPSLSESEEAEVEGYLDELRSLLPVLGITAFAPVSAGRRGQRRYHLKSDEWNATGYVTSNGFAVQAGSQARGTTVPSADTYVKVRNQLIADGLLVEEGEGFRLIADHEFNSPSAAATVFQGRNSNGRTDWKDAQGVSLKAHQEQEAESP
ncbi:GIY-YIG nuclease family protein [bacterium]|nr:GIY-YIG nuclease family protein [bacterium]MDA7668658.1 GIY-YIG nuclease family protein [bacterium]